MKTAVSFQNRSKPAKVIALSSANESVSLVSKISHAGKLVLPTTNGFVCIRYDDIIYLKAQSNYTEVSTKEKKHLFSKTLKTIAVQLPESVFCRVHKSYLVNVAYIQSYVSTGGDPHLILDNAVCIPVSRSVRGKLRSPRE